MKQTFKNFLAEYVKSLSSQNTLSIRKLEAEAATSNPRLIEPLFLLALFTDNIHLLLKSSRGSNLFPSYHELSRRYTKDSILTAFITNNPALPERYHRVWHSYQYKMNTLERDRYTNGLIREKVLKLREESGITITSVCNEIGCDSSNVNAWINYGKNERVGLKTARKVLEVFERSLKKDEV